MIGSDSIVEIEGRVVDISERSITKCQKWLHRWQGGAITQNLEGLEAAWWQSFHNLCLESS